MTGIREKPLRRASDSPCRRLLPPLDEHHVSPRDHDFPHDGVAELEHRVDHGPFAWLDDLPLLQQVDQAAQVLLGPGLALPVAAVLAGRQRGASGGEQPGQRPEHPDHRAQHGRRGNGHLDRVVPGNAARDQPGQHVAGHRHRDRRDQEGLPGHPEQVHEDRGHQYR